jgi:predicted dehydrogenase
MRAQLTCWYPDIEGNWRQAMASSGGGSLMDMGVHCIDLLQEISGSKVQRVCALTGTKTFSYEVEDSASLLMEFDNGAYGYVDANFNIPDNAAECRLEIYGTKGSILASGTISQIEGGNFKLTLSDDSGYDAKQDRNTDGSVPVDARFGNMYTKEIVSFGESIISNTPLAVPAHEAMQVQCVVENAYKSSKEKRFIEVGYK